MGKLSMIAFAVAGVWITATGTASADAITNAKAAELSLHRVERLVILKKIEDTYQSRFTDLAVTPVAHQADTDPAFQSLLRQGAGADGTFKSLNIVMDATGKAIQHTAIAGSEPSNPVAWSGVDPVTLSENSLHYILDNYTTEPPLQPFYVGLSTLAINPGTDASGAAVAVVEIHATANDPVLKITVKLDGTYESYQIVPRAE